MTPCPCCGRPYETRPDAERLCEYLPIAGVQRTLLHALLAGFGRTVSTKVLADVVYCGTDPPLTAESGIKVHVASIRRAIEPYGLRISGFNSARPSGFRLHWAENAA
jgi:hypothetical protein